MVQRSPSRRERCTFNRSLTLPNDAGFKPADLDLHESMPVAVRRAYRSSVLLFSPEQVGYAVDRLAVRLTVDWQDARPVCVVIVPRAMVFVGMLMQRLVFPLQLLSTTGSEVPAGVDAVAGRPVLLLDRAADVALHQPLAEGLIAAGATSVDNVVLLAGPQADPSYAYVGLINAGQNHLGCGFELEGYGGNLPGIYTYETT